MGKFFKNPTLDISYNMKLMLEKEIKSKLKFHYVIKHLIDVHSVIQIPVQQQPLSIIKTLKIDKRIEKELKSSKSFKLAQALRYSYKLGIVNHINHFKKNVDSSKLTVRREAQVGLVVFLGWDSLILFNKVTHPISLWQIIQVLDVLETHPRPSSFVLLERILESNNDDIVCLAIHCATRFGVNTIQNKIFKHEKHTNEKVVTLVKAYYNFIRTHEIPVILPLNKPIPLTKVNSNGTI